MLALLLFAPVSKLIWVLSVRRKERRLGRKLTEREVTGERARARFLAVLLVSAFSLLFNLQLNYPRHG